MRLSHGNFHLTKKDTYSRLTILPDDCEDLFIVYKHYNKKKECIQLEIEFIIKFFISVVKQDLELDRPFNEDDISFITKPNKDLRQKFLGGSIKIYFAYVRGYTIIYPYFVTIRKPCDKSEIISFLTNLKYKDVRVNSHKESDIDEYLLFSDEMIDILNHIIE